MFCTYALIESGKAPFALEMMINVDRSQQLMPLEGSHHHIHDILYIDRLRFWQINAKKILQSRFELS